MVDKSAARRPCDAVGVGCRQLRRFAARHFVFPRHPVGGIAPFLARFLVCGLRRALALPVPGHLQVFLCLAVNHRTLEDELFFLGRDLGLFIQ